MAADLFPPEAIAALRKVLWDPQATHSYEVMSGGFWWSDEMPPDVVSLCMEKESWAFRFVVGYRASLIRGLPREELRATWDQLLRECPNWPGFRPERRSPDLLTSLEREDRKFDLCLKRIERAWNALRQDK